MPGRDAYLDGLLGARDSLRLEAGLCLNGRMQACVPSGVSPARKYWPPVNRVDKAYGDRNLVCSCPPVETYAAESPPVVPAEVDQNANP